MARAKGFFWIASRPDLVGEVSQAGALVRHQGMGNWWVAVPKERWPDEDEAKATIMRNWDEHFGDRRQEIVFIGLSDAMDEDLIREQLNDCLVKDYLSNPNQYQMLNDPFPQWFDET